MYLKKPLSFSLLTFLCLVGAVAAEPVELFYFVNQRAYQVDASENGIPLLDKEVDAASIEYSGEHHTAWWYRGELPLEVEFATPLVDYRLKRIPQPYGQRDGEVQYQVDLSWGKVMPEVSRSNTQKDDWLVVGWVFEGELQRIKAMQPSKDWVAGALSNKLLIPASKKSGVAVLWHLRDGQLVPRDVRCEWDWVIDRNARPPEGQDVLSRDQQGRGAIFYAAANGMVEEARSLLESHKKLVKAQDESEYLPIRYAVENGRLEMVELLMEHGSAIVDGWGDLNSVVMLAATHGHFDVVKALMPDKPKGSTEKWHCSWAASEALNENYEDIAKYLLAFKPKIGYDGTDEKRVVFGKLSLGYPELGFSLMERYDIDPTFEVDGFTALHSISGYADNALLEKFSSLGVDPRERADDGKEALDFALGNGNVEAICWLIDHREEEIDDETLARSFVQAIDKGRISSVECLLGYGYDVNVKIKEGLTPLDFAIARREFDIARLLIEKGASMDPSSPYGDIVLARLIEGDCADLLAVLADQGLDWNREVYGDLSIRSAAEAVDAKKVLKLLDEGGISAGNSGEVYAATDLEEKPALLSPMVVSYSDELRARFGSRTELVDIVVSSQGQPLYVLPENRNLPKELFAVIEQGVTKVRFVPATVGGEPASFLLRTKIPLKADFELEKVFNLTDVDEKPAPIKMAPPYYPISMQQSRTRGQVVVEFTLMPNGTVRDVRPSKATHPAFEKPAVACVVMSTWQPARKNGKPVACKARIQVEFDPR